MKQQEPGSGRGARPQPESGSGPKPPPGSRAGATPQPEFEPLPSTWDEQAAALVGSFLSPRKPTAAELRALERFAHLCLRYAHMERRIQGEVRCDVPAHLTVIRGDHDDDDLPTSAELLAAAERENLEIPEGPIEDLGELLDDRGIKVIEWSRPAESEPCGAFLFDAQTGPALFATTPPGSLPGSPSGRLILAHEYCHLIADVDPYENRFCPQASSEEAGTLGGGRLFEPGRHNGGDRDLFRSEIRADLFARAFLLPAEHFLRSLRLFDIRPTRALSMARMGDLAFYYGVETPVALGRCADLGLLPPEEVRTMAGELAAPADPEAPEAPPASGPAQIRNSHPGRFINLGLAMFLKRLASLEQLAALFGTDPDTTRQFLAWCDLPQPGSKAPAQSDRPGESQGRRESERHSAPRRGGRGSERPRDPRRGSRGPRGEPNDEPD